MNQTKIGYYKIIYEVHMQEEGKVGGALKVYFGSFKHCAHYGEKYLY